MNTIQMMDLKELKKYIHHLNILILFIIFFYNSIMFKFLKNFTFYDVKYKGEIIKFIMNRREKLLDLNLFEDRKNNNNFVEKFIEELKNSLEKIMKRDENMKNENNDLEEYNLFEKRKIFLDNKSRKGNDLAWITDENSVCISEHGDGGLCFISEINLPKNVNVR